MEPNTPRFIIRFIEPQNLTPEIIEHFREIWNAADVERPQNRTAMFVSGEGIFDLLDLESGRVFRFSVEGIVQREPWKVLTTP